MLPTPDIRGLAARMALPQSIPTVRSVGRIAKLVGLTLESVGPIASIGDLVSIRAENADREDTFAEVVGFRDRRILLMPLDRIDGVRHDQRVIVENEGFRVPVGMALLGRVLDGLGRPLDGKGPVTPETHWGIHRAAPDAMSRPRIVDRFVTGVRCIDSTLACGRGQRIGIFAGSGVGKSVLLSMICRNCESDVNVIALTGERGKEVRDFLEGPLGEEGMRKSVVVVATSDRPPLQRLKAADTAMSIAEYFRQQGKHVLFIMDSLTRYALAQREIGLAIGEPPTTKGFPPSVFSLLARLLERAGTDARGSITGYFTVLAEGDDMNDPIVDCARSILDGHIVLSREIAGRGHYPAIDVLSSVSRVMNDVSTDEEVGLAREMRRLMSVYRKAEDMINIGAYKTGANPQIDRAIEKKEPIDAFLSQGIRDRSSWEATLAAMRTALS